MNLSIRRGLSAGHSSPPLEPRSCADLAAFWCSWCMPTQVCGGAGIAPSRPQLQGSVVARRWRCLDLRCRLQQAPHAQDPRGAGWVLVTLTCRLHHSPGLRQLARAKGEPLAFSRAASHLRLLRGLGQVFSSVVGNRGKSRAVPRAMLSGCPSPVGCFADPGAVLLQPQDLCEMLQPA